MNVYLASTLDTSEVLRDSIAPKIEAAGHTVTSRWIQDRHDGLGREATAVANLEDMEAASTVIVFTDPRVSPGKYFEFGFAVGRGKRVIILGGDYVCFYHLPNMRHARTIEEAILLI